MPPNFTGTMALNGIQKTCGIIGLILLLFASLWLFLIYPSLNLGKNSTGASPVFVKWFVLLTILFYVFAAFFAAVNAKGNGDKSKAWTAYALGLSLPVPLFNVLLGIIGIIFGILAVYEIKRNPDMYDGNGLAIAGIVLSSLPIIGGLFYLAERFFT
jgi:hypothetical protein